MRLTIQGYYGMDNFGDDLFCVSIAAVIQRLYPTLDYRVVSPPLSGLQGHTVPMPAWIIPLWSNPGALGGAFRAAVKVYQCWRSDSMLTAGGSVFSAVRGSRRLQAAILRGSRRQFAVGVSYGPFDGEEQRLAVQAYLSAFAVIGMRDRRSLADGSALGDKAFLSADIGACYDFGERDHDAVDIGVVPCAKSSISVRNLATVVDSLESALASRPGGKVRVLCLNPHSASGDLKDAWAILGELRKRGVPCSLMRYEAGNVEEVVRAIASMSLLLTGRLHGAVTAYQLGVPFLLDEYHVKCTDFLDDIGQARASRYAWDAPSFDAAAPRSTSQELSPSPPKMPPAAYSAIATAALVRVLDAAQSPS